MKLEVLIATMHQNDFSKLKDMNIQCDAVVVNQCDRNGKVEIFFCGHRILWIDSTERGLSKSRNMAIENATADICLLADDDIVYCDGYPHLVEDAFTKTPHADFIAFNTNMLNTDQSRIPIAQVRQAPKNKYYGSVRLAFRRKSVLANNLRFNEAFGAGARYHSGEESLLLRQARQVGLVVYENPGYLADVYYDTSTWFRGFTEEYYFDKGAFLAAAYGNSAYFYAMYFLLQSRKISKLPLKTVCASMIKGMKAYRNEKQ